MNLLLDTNILVYVTRARNIDAVVDYISTQKANLYISVVSEAEIRSLAIRNEWGSVRRNLMEDFASGANTTMAPTVCQLLPAGQGLTE